MSRNFAVTAVDLGFNRQWQIYYPEKKKIIWDFVMELTFHLMKDALVCVWGGIIPNL